ncbi:MAG TPA: LysM peptidoglycan-binding domain-containing protein [Gemmatimonadales bacterium]|nr:LysM peptidoglycan-binding domain-containing protein [Gemmatimonadales bacterium]
MTSLARLRLLALVAGFMAPAVLSAQTPKPDTHTVKPGDTLWDLAKQYLGDPFLWPEIYRLNTNVVEDPHWIYPGEVLRLAGGPEVSAVPSKETPPPPSAGQAVAEVPHDTLNPEAAAAEEPAAPLAEPQVGELSPSDTTSDNRDDVDLTPLVGDRRRQAAGPSLELSLQRNYRPIRRSEFFSSGFLTEGQQLPFARILGNVTPLQIANVSTRSTAQLYGRVAVQPPEGAKYQVGDTLLALDLQREIEGYGYIVVPTGLLRVVDVSRPEVLAEVVASYGPVRDQQRALPAEKFTDPGNVRPVPISDGVRGSVVGQRDQQPLTGPQDVVFLDKGRKDGVALGDLFELRQQPRERPGAATVVNEVMATVQVVHVSDRSATARVVSLIHPDIPAGTEARQVAKLPS